MPSIEMLMSMGDVHTHVVRSITLGGEEFAAEMQLHVEGDFHQLSQQIGSWVVHSDGVATEVVDGDVYVNGQWVAQAVPGQPLLVTQVNGSVQVNGQFVWIDPAILQRQEDAILREAEENSVLAPCQDENEEICPVCLEPMEKGQLTRTLPCFHALHADCAGRHFAASSRSRRDGLRARKHVQCPLCRARVGP
mmetsp:Transcript_4089/g.8254  ORF Transcript_4089/g.8254 Transcript_4089/m.8254 type:complete len:193 (+) Transcript_4089:2-580(+)